MKILILHPQNKNQQSLMESLCEQLNKFGIHTNRIEYNTYNFYSPNGDPVPWACRVYHFFEKIPKIRVISRKFFRKYIVNIYSNIIKDYDILDLQSSFVKDFAGIAEIAQKNGVKVKTLIWGSDFNLETPEQRPWKDRIYKYSDIIQLGPLRKETDGKFIGRYPKYSSKTRRAPVGRDQFDYLDKMFEHVSLQDYSFLSEQAKGKLMVTCGYNGREMQQHLLMLDAINKLPKELKQKIFLFLPMTYLLKDDYYVQVLERIEKTGIPYQIQRERLPLEQNLTMRIRTDITVNIQEHDGLASSIQEHLYCGNVLIAGEWLPYSFFTDNNVFYLKTSIDNLSINIKDVIEHFSDYKQKCINNRDNLYKITSWKAVLPKWKEMYDELLISK